MISVNKKIVVQDTADVIFTDLISGKVILNAEAQLAQITGAVSEEDLYGGIGNKKLYKLRSQKDINLSIRSAFASLDYWSMIQGVEVDDEGKATVTKSEYIKVTGGTDFSTDPTDIELVIPNVPSTLVDAIVVDKNGEQSPFTVAYDTATLKGVIALPSSDFAVGELVQVFYQEEITGNSVKIDSEKFSNKWKVEFRTISYDPDTAKVYSDIYFIFHEVIPSGEFDISLENGSVYTPEISFSVMTPKGSNELGEIIEVVR